MLRLLTDQNFNHDILRGLRERVPELDLFTTQELGKENDKDEQLLAWAAEENRVILTHDINTVTKHAYARLKDGEKMFGVIVVPQQMPVGAAVNELEIIVSCSDEDDFDNQVSYLPMLS